MGMNCVSVVPSLTTVIPIMPSSSTNARRFGRCNRSAIFDEADPQGCPGTTNCFTLTGNSVQSVPSLAAGACRDFFFNIAVTRDDGAYDKTRNFHIEATAKVFGRTGVEMEALTAVSVAALTVYDMCKAVDRGMTIERIRLEEKDGGKSGHFVREPLRTFARDEVQRRNGLDVKQDLIPIGDAALARIREFAADSPFIISSVTQRSR